MNKKVLRIVITAFLAAVISATGFFRIPVPGLQSGVVIQNAMCILTAVIIGSYYGALPSALFFFVGIIGVPVFAGWTGGFSVLANINGGYRIGWVLGALVAGLISGRACVEEYRKIDGTAYVKISSFVRIIIAVFAGMLALYIPEIFYVIAYRGDSAYINEYMVENLGFAADSIGQLAKYTPELIEKFQLDASLADKVINFTPELIAKLNVDEAQLGVIGTSGALKMFYAMFFAPFVLVDFIKSLFVIAIATVVRPVTAQYYYN